MQLRVGLYTFKVTVTAENKYGEAYVNVTVLPRKFVSMMDCIYKNVTAIYRL